MRGTENELFFLSFFTSRGLAPKGPLLAWAPTWQEGRKGTESQFCQCDCAIALGEAGTIRCGDPDDMIRRVPSDGLRIISPDALRPPPRERRDNLCDKGVFQQHYLARVVSGSILY